MALQAKNYDPAIMAGAALDVAVDLGEIRDANNNEILEFDAVASAVNNVVVANAATGNNPILYNGGEVDTGLTLAGSDGTNIEEILILDQNASAVNEFTIDNAATGSNPVIAATGDDTNLGIQLTPKGTAVVLLGNTSTGTIAAGTVTINAQRGVITTGAAITTAGTTTVYSFDFVNNKINVGSILALQVSEQAGAGVVVLGPVTRGNGSATIRLASVAHDAATTGSANIHFVVLN